MNLGLTENDKAEFVSELDFWKNIWEKNATHFHKNVAHPDLAKHAKLLITEKKGRVFIPLCGKTLDLIYFANKGQEVVGVEYSEIAVKEFFDQNALSFTKSQVLSYGVFKAKEKNITIFQGDFFKATADVLGMFDAIWDRGSFAAINPVNRAKYIAVISSLLQKDGKYLLNAFRYDPDKFTGPPHSITDSEIVEMFGEANLKVMKLEEYDDFGPKRVSWGLDFFFIKNFLLTFK